MDREWAAVKRKVFNFKTCPLLEQLPAKEVTCKSEAQKLALSCSRWELIWTRVEGKFRHMKAVVEWAGERVRERERETDRVYLEMEELWNWKRRKEKLFFPLSTATSSNFSPKKLNEIGNLTKEQTNRMLIPLEHGTTLSLLIWMLHLNRQVSRAFVMRLEGCNWYSLAAKLHLSFEFLTEPATSNKVRLVAEWENSLPGETTCVLNRRIFSRTSSANQEEPN